MLALIILETLSKITEIYLSSWSYFSAFSWKIFPKNYEEIGSFEREKQVIIDRSEIFSAIDQRNSNDELLLLRSYICMDRFLTFAWEKIPRQTIPSDSPIAKYPLAFIPAEKRGKFSWPLIISFIREM